ncbi:MAG: DUF6290 family protein [Gammaproteobacteria bacterium]|nr:DUF6290 family protein [Gammaproteobacteria bacterium]
MTIALRLPQELEDRLTILAKKTHRSKSSYAREALELHIEEMEDFYLSKAILANPGKIYSLEEVEKMCGLED